MISMFYQSRGTDPQLSVNNQEGWYYYRHVNGTTVMVTRNLMSIASSVYDKETTLDIELPKHPAFWLKVIGKDGDTSILIGKDGRLSCTIPENKQIQAVCPL